MSDLILELPINSVSFGQVSINILKELHRRKVSCSVYPIGDIDASAYKITPDFKAWLEQAINNRLRNVNRNTPTFRLWHFNGSDMLRTERQFLYTFYECDCPTAEEINILNLQTKTFMASSYNLDVFEMFGVESQKMAKLHVGLDPDFYVDPKTPRSSAINFGLIGKWEKRKNTGLIINTWAKKYGNNPRYMLHLLVYNPFLSQEQNNALLAQALEGKSYSNINILPRLRSNEEVNKLLNFIDIDLSGMSSAEGWGLPAFQATALGKWSCVVDAHAHREWATEDNAILVRPNGKQPVYDGMFFHQGMPFNQGNTFTFEMEDFVAAMDLAVAKAKTVNTKGLEIQQNFTYSRMVDTILSNML